MKLEKASNFYLLIVTILCSSIIYGCFQKRTGKLPENDPNTEPQNIEVTEKPTVTSWHRERVTNIRSETIEQLVENIANIDDYHFAISSFSRGYFPGEMSSETGLVINLFRVRRLFEEGQRNPEQVIPVLQQAYQEIHETWPDAKEEQKQKALKLKRIVEENGDYSSVFLTEPDLYMKNRTCAVAMTYLLAELQDHDSLSILLEGYKKHRNWIEEYGEGLKAAPVPTPMTLYAIHRLAVTLPENKMDSQTLAARSAYLEWADKYVPEPEIRKVTTWNADYDESDPYRHIVDPKGTVLTGQPSILMAKYPYKLKDGTFFFNGGDEDEQQKEKEWAELLIPFIEAAIKQNPQELNQ